MTGWTVRHVERTGSTNADVAAAARDGAAEGLVVVADHQESGRGRLGREWTAPPGTSLAVSFLLRPVEISAVRWPWLPLLVGVAVVDAVAAVAGVESRLKWPNDVLVDDRKLAGILVERIDAADGVAAVAGVGLNIGQTRAELPETATSLSLAGAIVSRDDLCSALAAALAERYTAWRAAAGAPEAGLAEAYRQRCDTLGRAVRAELPGGARLVGTAIDVDVTGRLVIETSPGATTAVGAGDVVHLRRQP